MSLLASSGWLLLAWFAAANIVAACAAVALVRYLGPAGLARRAPAQLLALRFGPAACATVFAAVVFLPVHWVYEPVGLEESFGFVIGSLAVTTAALLAWGGARATRALRESARFHALAVGHEVEDGTPAVVSARLHGVSLAGVFRTRILVGAVTRADLTDGELEAAIAHERAHQQSRDNLKRFLMFCAPDLFGFTSAARRLETAWRAAAECQADARAAAGSEARALDLASALVKVARGPAGPGAVAEPVVWSTLHDAPLLEERVRLLLARPAGVTSSRWTMWWIAGGLAAAVAAGWLAGYRLHVLTESLIQWLP
jgi:Zn-dependent protease with chaperone function